MNRVRDQGCLLGRDTVAIVSCSPSSDPTALTGTIPAIRLRDRVACSKAATPPTGCQPRFFDGFGLTITSHIRPRSRSTLVLAADDEAARTEQARRIGGHRLGALWAFQKRGVLIMVLGLQWYSIASGLKGCSRPLPTGCQRFSFTCRTGHLIALLPTSFPQLFAEATRHPDYSAWDWAAGSRR